MHELQTVFMHSLPLPNDLITFVLLFCDRRIISSVFIINQMWWTNEQGCYWAWCYANCVFCDNRSMSAKHFYKLHCEDWWSPICLTCDDGVGYLLKKYEKLFSIRELGSTQIIRYPIPRDQLTPMKLALRTFAEST